MSNNHYTEEDNALYRRAVEDARAYFEKRQESHVRYLERLRVAKYEREQNRRALQEEREAEKRNRIIYDPKENKKWEEWKKENNWTD